MYQQAAFSFMLNSFEKLGSLDGLNISEAVVGMIIDNQFWQRSDVDDKGMYASDVGVHRWIRDFQDHCARES